MKAKIFLIMFVIWGFACSSPEWVAPVFGITMKVEPILRDSNEAFPMGGAYVKVQHDRNVAQKGTRHTVIFKDNTGRNVISFSAGGSCTHSFKNFMELESAMIELWVENYLLQTEYIEL